MCPEFFSVFRVYPCCRCQNRKQKVKLHSIIPILCYLFSDLDSGFSLMQSILSHWFHCLAHYHEQPALPTAKIPETGFHPVKYRKYGGEK